MRHSHWQMTMNSWNDTTREIVLCALQISDSRPFMYVCSVFLTWTYLHTLLSFSSITLYTCIPMFHHNNQHTNKYKYDEYLVLNACFLKCKGWVWDSLVCSFKKNWVNLDTYNTTLHAYLFSASSTLSWPQGLFASPFSNYIYIVI